MTCPSCGTVNRSEARFCRSCGAELARTCPNGHSVDAGSQFCDVCGAQLESQAQPAPGASPPAAERRLVSVLFADLVGFTAASEGRDAEDTRELLSRYFDEARRLIERYGGTVEKFIGDAVMAVWGAPVAQEDDAERAVRAALDLVAAVPELDERLQARAGVSTGEAAVTLGAQGQGMVAGDLVNTASRIQAEAEPGTVLVGEATRRASEAAIAYEEAGEHAVKGKAEPLALSRALRVTAARRGAQKSAGLEAPFVGRDRELRVVKELLHGSADERRAHLVSVVGIAGIGKSRLAWEIEKYVDGLAGDFWWHRGRCLAYGEGVAYWALAEMVRGRADVLEGEEPAAARAKLVAAIAEQVADEDERAWIEPRLAQLLGLEERQAYEREDLFAGWRLFFERLADRSPVVMVFEDMQWADVSLLEFVEYLLEWSRSHPIFVLTLARPELVERHPQWGAGKRNFTSLALEPLSEEAMDALLAGLVPGLPEELRRRIRDRAEGVPLYAVETVRMLLDRGLLERDGDVYRPAAAIEQLDVPETLHALVAARLDGLAPDERTLVRDAAVLGRTFSKQALVALSGRAEDEIEPLLASLVRKEVLSLQADPRSPERGQYGFVQDLLKRVAYETLARAERKTRHLAAAAHLESAFGAAEQEVVEVIAAHYVGAYDAAPGDPDAAAIKENARERLSRAGERAAALAASEEAARYFAQAADLADEPPAEAELRERVGQAAVAAGRPEQAQLSYERARELFEQERQTHPAARVSARLGEVEWLQGKLDQALERMERAFAVLSADEPDADFAALAAQLGRLQFFKGNFDRSAELLEIALSLAESLRLTEVLSQAMNSYGVIAMWRRRPETAEALYTHALKLALEHDLPTPALRAHNNLADSLTTRDRFEEAIAYYERGIALARRVGHRQWEWTLLLESCYPLMQAGRWDEAIERAGETADVLAATTFPGVDWCEIEVARGRVSEVRPIFDRLAERFVGSSDVQLHATFLANSAVILLAESDAEGALAAGEEGWATREALGTQHQNVKTSFVYGVEAAFALGLLDKVEEVVKQAEALRPGELPPSLEAHARRFRARLSAARGEHDEVGARFLSAASIFREYGMPFWLAVSELEHAEWLVEQGRADEAEPLFAEAREIFERLEATPWLERTAKPALPVEATA
jgi:class 3 adenylate cyclase/tetratricopeptide (TPR) repeat protein